MSIIFKIKHILFKRKLNKILIPREDDVFMGSCWCCGTLRYKRGRFEFCSYSARSVEELGMISESCVNFSNDKKGVCLVGGLGSSRCSR